MERDRWERDGYGRIVLPVTDYEKKEKAVSDVVKWVVVVFLIVGYLYGC